MLHNNIVTPQLLTGRVEYRCNGRVYLVPLYWAAAVADIFEFLLFTTYDPALDLYYAIKRDAPIDEIERLISVYEAGSTPPIIAFLRESARRDHELGTLPN